MKKCLFLCTGNYYRSRFAEYYLRHLIANTDLRWTTASRGLALSDANEGALSIYTQRECERLGVSTEPLDLPKHLLEADLISSDHVIAVKETEHRALMRNSFPEWEDRIDYWEVHDLDCATPKETLGVLRELVENLFATLK